MPIMQQGSVAVWQQWCVTTWVVWVAWGCLCIFISEADKQWFRNAIKHCKIYRQCFRLSRIYFPHCWQWSLAYLCIECLQWSGTVMTMTALIQLADDRHLIMWTFIFPNNGRWIAIALQISIIKWWCHVRKLNHCLEPTWWLCNWPARWSSAIAIQLAWWLCNCYPTCYPTCMVAGFFSSQGLSKISPHLRLAPPHTCIRRCGSGSRQGWKQKREEVVLEGQLWIWNQSQHAPRIAALAQRKHICNIGLSYHHQHHHYLVTTTRMIDIKLRLCSAKVAIAVVLSLF